MLGASGNSSSFARVAGGAGDSSANLTASLHALLCVALTSSSSACDPERVLVVGDGCAKATSDSGGRRRSSPLYLLPNSFLAPACLPVSLPLSSFLSSPALPRVYASVRARTRTVRQSRPQPHMKGGPNRRYHAHIHTYMSASAHTYTHTYAPGSQCLSRAGPARRWRWGRRCHAPTSSPACGHAHALGPLASAR